MYFQQTLRLRWRYLAVNLTRNYCRKMVGHSLLLLICLGKDVKSSYVPSACGECCSTDGIGQDLSLDISLAVHFCLAVNFKFGECKFLDQGLMN